MLVTGFEEPHALIFVALGASGLQVQGTSTIPLYCCEHANSFQCSYASIRIQAMPGAPIGWCPRPRSRHVASASTPVFMLCACVLHIHACMHACVHTYVYMHISTAVHNTSYTHKTSYIHAFDTYIHTYHTYIHLHIHEPKARACFCRPCSAELRQT